MLVSVETEILTLPKDPGSPFNKYLIHRQVFKMIVD